MPIIYLYTNIPYATFAFELQHLTPDAHEQSIAHSPTHPENAVVLSLPCKVTHATHAPTRLREHQQRHGTHAHGHRYNWQGLSQLRGLGAKARRSLAQLGPYSWDRFEWCQFSSPKRFLQVCRTTHMQCFVAVYVHPWHVVGISE